MKRVYDFVCYISIDGGEFRDTSIFPYYIYCERKSPYEEIKYCDFMSLYNAVKSSCVVHNAEAYTSLFGKPKVRLSFADANPVSMSEKNFKPVTVRWALKPVNHLTMDTLSKLLPAEDFAEWLKDRGIYRAK